MNVSKLLVGAALAISMIGVSSTFYSGANAAEDKKICSVKAFQPNKGEVAEPGKKFTRIGDKVFIGVHVEGNDCTRNVTLAGWLADSFTGQPYRQQTLYDSKTEKFTPGNYVMSMNLPKDATCFAQIDLVRGTDPYGKNDGGAYEEGRMIHSLHTGTKDCNKLPEQPEQPQSKKIWVCDYKAMKVVQIDEKAFDASRHTHDFSRCKPTTPGDILVCEKDSMEVITIKETEFDATKHSHTLTDCNEETPQVIASTGPAAVISAISGVAALAGSASYYWQSRRR